LNAYPTCYQDMSDEAVAKVAWAFAKHGIALHIDRGEMGGGMRKDRTFLVRV